MTINSIVEILFDGEVVNGGIVTKIDEKLQMVWVRTWNGKGREIPLWMKDVRLEA